MTKQEIAKLIKEHYNFLNEPSEEEISAILKEISNSTTENEFDKIVLDNISKTSSHCLESIDMSASTSILMQIKSSLNK